MLYHTKQYSYKNKRLEHDKKEVRVTFDVTLTLPEMNNKM